MIAVNDVVLVYVDGKVGFYARIEEIEPDYKQGWWQVQLLVLTFPLQIFNWILDERQLAGGEFTMGGTPLRMEKVVSPIEQEQQRQIEEEEQRKRNALKESAGVKVVSLADHRKK